MAEPRRSCVTVHLLVRGCRVSVIRGCCPHDVCDDRWEDLVVILLRLGHCGAGMLSQSIDDCGDGLRPDFRLLQLALLLLPCL